MRPPAAYKTKTEMGNAFIFDFDGTLAETIPLTLAAIRSAYADNGCPRRPKAKLSPTSAPTSSECSQK